MISTVARALRFSLGDLVVVCTAASTAWAQWEPGSHSLLGELATRNPFQESRDQSMTTRFIRHGDLMTVLAVIEDPIYLPQQQGPPPVPPPAGRGAAAAPKPDNPQSLAHVDAAKKLVGNDAWLLGPYNVYCVAGNARPNNANAPELEPAKDLR